jgi:hypothetical protein
MDWIIADHRNDQLVAGFSGQSNLSTSRFRGVVQNQPFLVYSGRTKTAGQ